MLVPTGDLVLAHRAWLSNGVNDLLAVTLGSEKQVINVTWPASDQLPVVLPEQVQ